MEESIFEKGLKVRKDVLGEEYVNKALATADDFSGPLQKLVTEYCWGTVWVRDGLSREMRSLLNVGMIAALNRPNELALHIRGALNNGCTKEQILEVILQVAIYCGVPAAVDSNKIAREVFEKYEQKTE